MNALLKKLHSKGLQHLINWRNRYPREDYGSKVMLNVFYRKYTILFMWHEIQSTFVRNSTLEKAILWTDVNYGYKKMSEIYQRQSTYTHRVLLGLLKEESDTMVGGISYSSFYDKIRGSQLGYNEDVEDIEYTFLHYFLNDQLILFWSAFGGTGLTKEESVYMMSGIQIEGVEMTDYSDVESVLAQLCTRPYLKDKFIPLSPLYVD